MTDKTVVNIDDDSDEAYLAQEGIVLFADEIKVIEDDATFHLVAKRLVTRREWIARVEAWFAPLAKAAHDAHRAITSRRAAIIDGPRKQCDDDARALSAYEARKRREAEIALARAQQEAREAVEVARRDGVEVKAVPVVTPPMPAVPKAPGMTFTDQWFAEVTDLKALALAVGQGRVEVDAIAPVLHYLNDKAVALKSAMNIPGVEARSKRVPRRT